MPGSHPPVMSAGQLGVVEVSEMREMEQRKHLLMLAVSGEDAFQTLMWEEEVP